MSVTFARGFRAAGVTAGLKSSGTRDLAVVVNDGPRWDAAGVFTSNRIQLHQILATRTSDRGESGMPLRLSLER